MTQEQRAQRGDEESECRKSSGRVFITHRVKFHKEQILRRLAPSSHASPHPQSHQQSTATHSVRNQLVALGRPSRVPVNPKHWPSCPVPFWQSTTSYRLQKGTIKSWGAGKGSGKVFTWGPRGKLTTEAVSSRSQRQGGEVGAIPAGADQRCGLRETARVPWAPPTSGS